MPKKKWGALEVFGVETEYMIVDRETLAVRPWAEKVLAGKGGRVKNKVINGAIAWSNELASHVIEMKLSEPAPKITGIGSLFHENALKINEILAKSGAMLLPSGMHPFLDPASPENPVELWPHGQKEIYNSYNRIFGCGGHGWVNVQSSHLNISYATEEEFVRLHAVIRFVLPLIPGLAASTPVYDGRASGSLDSRLKFYGENQKRVPEISGEVIPEIVRSRDEYKRIILGRMYEAIKPYDPDGLLQDEWLNSRGAIARFDRSAIEIRVIDSQESPLADEAVLALVSGAVRALYEAGGNITERVLNYPTETLVRLYNESLDAGEGQTLPGPEIALFFGISGASSVGEFWSALYDKLFPPGSAESVRYGDFIAAYRNGGTLSSRILSRFGFGPGSEQSRKISPEAIREVYGDLARCLEKNQIFGKGG